MKTISISRARLFMLAALAALLPLAIGCGDGLNRVKMSGTVSYDGQPVVDGIIRFVPKAGTEAPLTVELIKDGRYSTKTSGGVPAGSYKVDIRAFNPGDPIPSGPGAPARKQLLPLKYNNQTELEITLDPGQKQLEHNFELTK